MGYDTEEIGEAIIAQRGNTTQGSISGYTAQPWSREMLVMGADWQFDSMVCMEGPVHRDL